MLQKNVYILYPPGYCGSYINWAINASDNDLQSVTVKNPINNNSSKQFGGAGTSHLHVRLPTHQGIEHHLSWVLLNRPTDKRVYIISTDKDEIYFSIKVITQYDPDAVFISVHNDDNDIVDSFANINCVTKWPTYLDIMSSRIYPIHDKFNPYDCADDSEFRNYVVKHNHKFFRHNTKLSQEKLNRQIDKQQKWYDIRHRAQPHEVNETMYITDVNLTNRVFELSCADVCGNSFLPWFSNFMALSQVSTGYTLDTVQQNHSTYVQAQPNLQWFDSIAQWERTGELDDYLLSHSMIHAQVILQIFKHSNTVFLDWTKRDRWTSFYSRCRGPDWPDAESEYDYFDLPDWVKKEITEFGYELNLTSKPNSAILKLDWENISVSKINQVYQQTK